MKSRLALIAVLALGALMSMGGAAFGVSALSSGTTAGTDQYGPCTPPPNTPPNTPPSTPPCTPPPPHDCSTNPSGTDNNGKPCNEVKGDCSTNPNGTDSNGQPCTPPKKDDCSTNPKGTDANGQPCGEVKGDRSGGSGSNPSDVAGAQDTSPNGTNASGTAPEAAKAQAPRQVKAANDDELPFTGYAAIPMLLIGVALLGGGMMLRRNTRGNTGA